MIALPLSDPVEALNAGLFVSPGFGTHPERVIDSWELVFVTQGSLDLFEGKRSLHVERNHALLLSPGVRHGGLFPYRPDLNFYWAHFIVHELRAPGVRLAVPKVAAVRGPEALTELFCRFISDQESGLLDRCSASHLIALMLSMIGESTVVPGTGPAAGREERHCGREDLVEEVRRFIEAGYRRPISTSAIARALGYNPDYLERVFRSREGISIVDAIHRKRIAEARAALFRDARRNINEIGFACGYADPGYFRRMFRRLTGLTPREFRSLYARTHINTH